MLINKKKYIKKYNICSEELFMRILDRERSRSDRSGKELSLVVFDVDEKPKSKFIKSFIKILNTRARKIDKFGWFNENQIGILLPSTSHEGGSRFVRAICEQIIMKEFHPPDYTIYSYPSRRSIKEFILNNFDTIKKKKTEQCMLFVDGVNPIFTKRIPKWKRSLDIVGALIILCLASPLFLILPIVIKLVSPGPVLFKQERVGYGGKLFTLLKFRSMEVEADTELHHEHSSDFIHHDKPMDKLDERDPRINPWGAIMRKTCIDELPQVINVLKGEMSLVGPRPCISYEAKEYLKWHRCRFEIYPGITGLWQVSGKNRLNFKEMMRLDIKYGEEMSIWLDLLILFKTIPAVISIIKDKIKIDSFYSRMKRTPIQKDKFKEFIKRYYSDIYNVDKLEFIDDKLKDYHIDLTDLMLLLSKLHSISPSYNVARRYFGICRLIDAEKKAQYRTDIIKVIGG